MTGACTPDTARFGGSLVGTVRDTSAQPVNLVSVFVVHPDDAMRVDKAEALTNGNGRFRLDVPAGTWTLIATNYQGVAAFKYEVTVANGATLDVGDLYLSPCAEPGSGTDGTVYEECPENDDEAAPYGTPTTDLHVGTFVPDYTDAVLYESGTTDPDTLYVAADSYEDQLRLELSIPSTSPYYGPGTHSLDTSDGYSRVFCQLIDHATGVFWVLRTGTLAIESFEAAEGGEFRARLEGASFDYYDIYANSTSGAYVATIDDTSPAMLDSIALTTPSGRGYAQPGQSYSFPVFTPDFTQVYYVDGGGAWVSAYEQYDTGAFLQVYFEVPAEFAGEGTHAIANDFTPGAWNEVLHGTATYYDNVGEYHYVLQSMTWQVSDAATGPGDSFAATVAGAVFLWQSDPGAQPYETLTLTIETSGAISANADDPEPPPPNGGHDWTDLHDDLVVTF